MVIIIFFYVNYIFLWLVIIEIWNCYYGYKMVVWLIYYSILWGRWLIFFLGWKILCLVFLCLFICIIEDMVLWFFLRRCRFFSWRLFRRWFVIINSEGKTNGYIFYIEKKIKFKCILGFYDLEIMVKNKLFK